MIDLGYRDVEAVAQPVLQALHDVALVLERMRILDVYLDGQNADYGHKTQAETPTPQLLNRQFGRDTLHGERLEHVTGLHVVEI